MKILKNWLEPVFGQFTLRLVVQKTTADDDATIPEILIVCFAAGCPKDNWLQRDMGVANK